MIIQLTNYKAFKCQGNPKHLLLGLLFFFFNFSFAQTPPISISWDMEVGCQTYKYDKRKDLFIEDIGSSECMRVCERSVVTYMLTNLPSGSTTVWDAVGGSINFQNNTTCEVLWSTLGTGSLSFTITTPQQQVITKSICIERVAIPVAKFEFAPSSQPQNPFYTCMNQTVDFINLSSTGSGTNLVSYHWDFGDGTSSVAFEPTHIYTNAQTYEVILTVTNECNCTDKVTRKITVKEGNGFEISCPSVVCEDQTEIYSLPFNGMDLCDGNFNWTVQGGHKVSEAGGNVEVIWDNVGPGGFGYVTFDPSGCDLECPLPTTIKIPVIQSNGSIKGASTICLGEQERYKLPQWPTTDFQWEVVGNSNNNLATVINTDQRNEVIVQPTVAGTIILRATYINTLLNCGGTAEFTITVGNPVAIQGDEFVCLNTNGNYSTTTNVTANWQLIKTSTNTTVNTLTNSTSYSYNFTQAGDYRLVVTKTGFCTTNMSIKVLPAVPDPEGIIGETDICPNAPYNYTVENPESQYSYEWTVANGSFIGSSTGEDVTVVFNGTLPASISVKAKTDSPLTCLSGPTTLPVIKKQILAEIGNINTTVCANSIENYQLNDIGATTLFTDFDELTWSLSNPDYGSISAGQDTNQISVTWNNLPTSSPQQVTLLATVKKCTVTEVLPLVVTITPVPTISITGNNTICSGEQTAYTVNTSAGFTLPPGTIVYWDFGNGNYTQGGLSEPHTFNNLSGNNVSVTVHAYIINPNGCIGTTNIAAFTVNVLPGPVATLSLSSSNGNAFCNLIDVDVDFTAATSSGASIKWFQNGLLLSNTGSTLHVGPSLGYGSYYFIATGANGCSTKSNTLLVRQNCAIPLDCTLSPLPVVTNTSSNTCGAITLSGTASPAALAEEWAVYGPQQYVFNAATTFTTIPGEYIIFHRAKYLCQEGYTGWVNEATNVVVPYIADFAYAVSCTNNNTFTVDFIDKTGYYAPISGNAVFYYQSTSTPSSWTTVSGTSITLPAGNYNFKVQVNGSFNGIAQPTCEKTISNITLNGIPNLTITYTPSPIACHDTPVKFGFSGPPLTNYSFLWDFDDNAQNTLSNPDRVFTTSGVHTISVVVTNSSGCTRTFSQPITIPDKCFSGDVVASPANAVVCKGEEVTLTYVPNGDNCAATQYTWMNGNTLVTTTTTPSLTVNTPGFYWVRAKSNLNCTYSAPTRITPAFLPLPSVKLKTESSVCVGDAVVVAAITNATTLVWSLNGIPQNSWNNHPNPVFNNLPVGSHTISISASTNGCTVVKSTTVAVVAPPQNISITKTLVSCTPYKWQLIASATGNPTYNWSDGQSGASIFVSEGGPYKVTATIGGCSITTQTDVPKNPENYMWIFPKGCYDDCKNKNMGNVLIGPDVALPYWAWNFNGVTQSSGINSYPSPFTITDSGSYTLTIDTYACDLTSEPLSFTTAACEKCNFETKINYLTPIAGLGYCAFALSMDIYSNTTIPFSAVFTNVTNNVVITPASFTIQPGLNSNMLFTIIPVNPFTGGQGIDLEIQSSYFDVELGEEIICYHTFKVDLPNCNNTEGKTTDTKNTYQKENHTTFLQLFPNPAKEYVTLQYQLPVPKEALITIYDLTGRIMETKTLSNHTGQEHIQTRDYPAGIYIVTLTQDEQMVLQQKLVIE